MPEVSATVLLLLLLAGGLLLAAVIWVVWRRSGGVARTPVDLTKPITSAGWQAIRRHASDLKYRKTVEIVRNDYLFVPNPMLLPNTLRKTMSQGFNFREAMICVAEDHGGVFGVTTRSVKNRTLRSLLDHPCLLEPF